MQGCGDGKRGGGKQRTTVDRQPKGAKDANLSVSAQHNALVGMCVCMNYTVRQAKVQMQRCIAED